MEIRNKQQSFDVSPSLVRGKCLDVVVVEKLKRNADLAKSGSAECKGRMAGANEH